ncbi:MAG: hypothetical protein ACKO45_08140 [Cyanobium sp.]
MSAPKSDQAKSGKLVRLVTKIFAGTLLGIGLPITLSATASLIWPQTTSAQMREGALPVIVMFSLWSAFGGWLFWNGARIHERKRQDQLLACFFRLIKQNEGRVTPLSFAAESGMNGSDARAYLDARSKEFNGSFDVDTAGNMIYQFSHQELKNRNQP